MESPYESYWKRVQEYNEEVSKVKAFIESNSSGLDNNPNLFIIKHLLKRIEELEEKVERFDREIFPSNED